MLTVLSLCLGFTQSPTPTDPAKVTASIEEVYRVDSNGAAIAFDGQGVMIPKATDPAADRSLKTARGFSGQGRAPFEQGIAPAVPTGRFLYRVVLKLTTDGSRTTFGRPYGEGKDHERVEVNQVSGTGNATGMREVLTFMLPADQTSTVLHCKAASGPYETVLDATIDDGHPHGLVKVENLGVAATSGGPSDLYEYDFPPEELGKYEQKGTASFSDGSTALALFPMRRLDQRTGQVGQEFLWFNGTKGAKPTHLVVQRRAFQVLLVGPVQLRPNGGI